MTFRNPQYFFALIPLVLLLGYLFRQSLLGKNSPAIKVPRSDEWQGQGKRQYLSPRFWSTFVCSLAAVFFIIALARPQTSQTKVKKSVEGIDIMLVLDLSQSMRIEDFRDQNRLDAAKPIIQSFIEGRPNDKIGFQTFSGEAVTLVPPTLDHTILLSALESAEIGDLKDGTAIGDALATAVGRMKESFSKSKVIILLTDGDSNVGSVDPLTAGELAKGFGIKVYSIAIGKDGKAPIPFVHKDMFGRTVKTYQYYDSSINPELLKKISSTTDGKFYRVQGDSRQLENVFDDINELEKYKMETSEQVKFDEKFEKPVWIGLFILLAGFLLQNTVMRVYP